MKNVEDIIWITFKTHFRYNNPFDYNGGNIDYDRNLIWNKTRHEIHYLTLIKIIDKIRNS